YRVGLELDHAAREWSEKVPGFERYVVRGDAAAPQSISYLRRHWVPRMEAAPKWSGSVEDGIRFLRQSEEIVIHPRCVHAQEEARLYSYRVDKHTGDVLPDIEDRHNHVWDAVRYALAPLIKQTTAAPQFYSGLSYSTR